jgi:Tol biopolymer transport system component/tRNA A-37 threonylcarbamoyl transferase component Bud32
MRDIAAALADRYRLLRELGAGGMATVYLAEDLKHDRKVAIKVLKPELAAVLGADRFVQEIKTTAALQHPHILPLFDSGTADGFLFYVMPYIEGETIREKLNRETQFGVDEAVRITREVADALDYAHRHGVIHRDIKPENILLHDGRAMVMDFGIALAVSAAASGRMTETGLSLGTPHYMSPEQATAEKDITARSDVYSLGSVLYEMLTGNPPHTGASAQQIIMKIITEEAAPVTQYRKSVPHNVAAAVAKSIEKLPADRFESAKAFADALANPSFGIATSASGTGAGARPHRSLARDIGVGLAGAAVAAAAVMFALRPGPLPVPVPARFRVLLPDSFTIVNTVGSTALARDGSLLAVLCAKDGMRFICLRRLGDVAMHVVAGSEGALYPTFSAAGDWLLFSSGTSLRKVSVGGGTPVTVYAGGTAYPAWMDDGSIVFTQDNDIWRMNGDGSDRRRLTKYGSRRTQPAQAAPLPGQRAALISKFPIAGIVDSARLAVVSLDDGSVSELGLNGAFPRYAAPGWIMFERGDGALMAAPFSLKNHKVTGPPSLLIDHGSGYAVAANGTLAFVVGPDANIQSMYVVDRQGNERPLPPTPRAFKEPRVSPDGQHIAVRIGQGAADGGLWIFDVAGGTLTRFTADSESIRGEWTRDGKRIVYVDHALADTQVVISRPWDNSGPPSVLAKGGRLDFYQIGVGPPGGWSAVRRGGSNSSSIFLAPTDTLSAVRLFIRGSPTVLTPRVSPDGHLLAYTSNESGRPEIYVRQIPGPGPVIPVSVDGGAEPIWSADGATLFYRGPKRLMAAAVREQPTFAVTRRDSLFEDTYRRYPQHSAYDVFPNGREFVMTRGPRGIPSELHVIVNWTGMVGKQGGASTAR